MALEYKVTVDYAKRSLGQRDELQSYSGRGVVNLTTNKVQIIDKGLIVFEMERADWVGITGMLR